jgi:lysozyme family protein
VDFFDGFLPDLKTREGGSAFTNRPADKGGPTRWGIDAATLGEWRKLGRPATAAEVQALGEPEADAIYRARYYQAPGFNLIAPLSAPIAAELVDSGINLGTHWPSVWLQEDLNLCNRQGADYADLPVTGHVGPMTAGALARLIAVRGQAMAEDLILKCLNSDQLARYKAITQAGGPNGAQEQNFCGWVSKRIGLI